MRLRAWLLGVAVLTAQAETLVPYQQVDGSVPRPLTAVAGDVQRGRALVANRQLGLCLLCHTAPIAEERFQGNLAPDLSGAGSRWTEGQLRLRLIDARQINGATTMPAYYRSDGLQRVAPGAQGQTLFNPQQLEDVVAYLASLR